MMVAYTIRKFEDSTDLETALVAEVTKALRQSIAERECASLAVSGGSTPVGFFQSLSQQELDWSRVIVTLVDERWTDEGSQDSNAYLVARHLLQNRASNARFVGLHTAAASPFAALPDVERRLQEALPLPFAAVILGMGSDGHTASFFPHAETLAAALAPQRGEKVAAIEPPSAPYQRITLTLPLLFNTGRLFLHIVGEQKWQVWEQALEGGEVVDMPVRAVLGYERDNCPLEVFYAHA